MSQPPKFTNWSFSQWNKEFEAASPEDKRRIVAQDVIAQVLRGRYIPYSTYLSPEEGGKCSCCGIGACLASFHQISDEQHTITTIYRDHTEPQTSPVWNMTVWEPVVELFGKKQLALIEEFYENRGEQCYGGGGMFNLSAHVSESEIPVIRFAKRYFSQDSTERMIQIMDNIVRNGKFDYNEEIRFQENSKSVEGIDFSEAMSSTNTTDNKSEQHHIQLIS